VASGGRLYDDEQLRSGMNDHRRMDALPKFLFGGESFARQNATETKRALIVDGICLLLLLLGLAGAAAGQSQDQQKDQKPQQQSSNESASPATPAGAQQEGSVAEAARKAKAKKAKKEKKVYGDEDLAGMKGGVSVVGDAKATAATNNGEQTEIAVSDQETVGSGGKKDEQYWRRRAQKLHAQMDATDDQIKNLKEDIKKNGAAGFDAQTGLRKSVIYVDDKNARLQKLEDRKKALEQSLDQLQDEARKADVPSEWVR
jgi:hypothetical protein